MSIANGKINVFMIVVLIISIRTSSCNGIPKLILISMDSFMHDYLDVIDPSKTEHFQYFINNGVRAKWVNNVFPSSTYPNHYSMITGLYPESHGIVNNRFYDPNLKKHFRFNNRSDNFDSKWYDVGAEPIYVTNNKADRKRKSGSVVWPAGLAKVKGIAPDRIIPNADSFSEIPFTERVDKLISWFTADTDPINLGLLYFPEPDEISHEFGPDSDEVKNEITGPLNTVLGYILSKLRQHGLFDSTNIVLTSDHGQTNIAKFVMLDDFLDRQWYDEAAEFLDTITLELTPKEGYESKILQILNNITDINVFTKGSKELQDLHYNDNDRIAPIVIQGHEGIVILRNETDRINIYSHMKGLHGYDPRRVARMRPFFLAMGPAFKTGFLSKPIDMVDIYPLMCHILGIDPAPNNGSLENVKQILIQENGAVNPTSLPYMMFVGLCTTALYLGN